MLISLNWIRDYVDLPGDPDPIALAERFTRTTAEVDGVHRIEVAASGLICAAVKSLAPLSDSGKLRLVTLDIGGGKTAETVSAAPVLAVGDRVLYAPPGASVKSLGPIGATTVAGRSSAGMILAADALGIDVAGQEAVFLSSEFNPGDAPPPEPFDDWLIEIDNKSLTNRPDLWGHYGIAREIAAIVRRSLSPFPGETHGGHARHGNPRTGDGSARAEACGSLAPMPVVALEELRRASLPEIPITIADPVACPRYSALVVEGVPTQPAPLWMQLRLGHVGQRPISGLVDLTNYVMMDLGQPMHAFDAARVRRIEVDWAADGEQFRTLDGVERTLTTADLMIKSGGRSVALAGVMGGLDTEVTPGTTALLLESANFNGATVRRTTKRLNLRTEAGARFEKSLDPANTVLAIQRFVHLARAMYPDMRITSRLSDGYPKPAAPVRVLVQPNRVARTIGRPVPLAEARDLLAPLGFEVSNGGAGWTVAAPSHRATGDVSIEADVIEELARSIGYDSITPDLPRVTVRTFPLNVLHELEQRSIEYFTMVHAFNEIHGYLWYDSTWLARIGCDPGPCVELRNPAGEGLHRLRRSLLPGLLAAVAKNRFHFDSLALLELGSVFEPAMEGSSDRESRHVALAIAQRGKNLDDRLNARLRSAIEGWAWNRFARPVRFIEPQDSIRANPDRPRSGPAPCGVWLQDRRAADIVIGDSPVGCVGVIDAALRRAMDDHLAAWGVAWTEIRLDDLQRLPRSVETLGAIPPFPLVDEDFSILVPRTVRYAAVAESLARFAHPLLKSVRFVTSFEGDARTGDRRSLTFRCTIGHDARTLSDADAVEFRDAFGKYLMQSGLEIRKG